LIISLKITKDTIYHCSEYHKILIYNFEYTMLAVIELGGNQFIVRKGDVIDVKKQDLKEKAKFTTPVLLLSDEDGKETKIGAPLVEGASVELKVVEHFKAKKVRVFKMKAKKRYMRNRGFRAQLTRVEVLSVA